jgi:RNA polymerase sigma factor (TIGR02999 family)
MSSPSLGEATRLLQAVRSGDAGAADRLAELLYGELHALAQAQARPGGTLQPTVLVHEAWLKLHGNLADLQDRRHFFAVASRAMRQVLANWARAARAMKRGEGRIGVTLDAGLCAPDEPPDVVALDDSLARLATLNERYARVVELRFLCSLSIEETAEALDVSTATVERDWAVAQAWLRRELRRV